jgi:hypothetical protein
MIRNQLFYGTALADSVVLNNNDHAFRQDEAWRVLPFAVGVQAT